MLFARKGAQQRKRSLIQLRAQPFPADADAFTVAPLSESANVALFINRGEATEINDLVNPVNAADLVVVVVVIADDTDAAADGEFGHDWVVLALVFVV